MAHVITALCLRDGACVDVCPVECIIKGMPEAEWPWFFIDPNTCIDCGACVPECPYEAIFPESEVPEAYTMKAGQGLQPFGADRITAEGGEVVDLYMEAASNPVLLDYHPFLPTQEGDILGTPRRRSLKCRLPSMSSRTTSIVHRSSSSSIALATGQNWP